MCHAKFGISRENRCHLHHKIKFDLYSFDVTLKIRARSLSLISMPQMLYPCKGVRALMGLFGPTENCFSQISFDCVALTILLDNIFIRFGTKLYRQVVGIPMGTNCAPSPLVADSFLFCYERGFMMSLSNDYQADVIDAFNTASRYLDDILNINNVYFDNMVSQIYPSELQYLIPKPHFRLAFVYF